MVGVVDSLSPAVLDEFESKTGLKFDDRTLLSRALTHSSFANQKKVRMQSNERLEFFGDSVLKLLVSEYLLIQFTDHTEGQLSKLRAKLISDEWLSGLAVQLGIGPFIRFSNGERLSGGDKKSSNLANVIEALLGAAFLDRGLAGAREFLRPYLEQSLKEPKRAFIDPKTELQERLQRKGLSRPSYRVVEEVGPEHEKWFEVVVDCSTPTGETSFSGKGLSKKAAEQAAAMSALEGMGG